MSGFNDRFEKFTGITSKAPVEVKPSEAIAKPQPDPTKNGAQKPADKPAEEPVEIPEFGSEPATPKTDAQKPTAEAPLPSGIKELRAVAEERGKALKAKDAEITTWKTKATEYEAKLKESSTASEEVKTLKERAEKAENALRYSDYRQSQEYTDKFVKPRDAAKAALESDLKGLMIANDDGTEREATVADFAPLLDLSGGQAAILATKLFGAAAPEILNHRRELLRLVNDANKAVEEWRVKGSERAGESERTQKATMEKAASTYASVLKQAREDKNGWFTPPSNEDTEAHAQFTKDEQLVKTAFMQPGGDPIPEGLNQEEQQLWVAKKIANVAARASAFGAQNIKLRRAQKELAEWKSKYEELKGSEPGNMKRNTSVTEEGDDSKPQNWENRLDKFASAGPRR